MVLIELLEVEPARVYALLSKFLTQKVFKAYFMLTNWVGKSRSASLTILITA